MPVEVRRLQRRYDALGVACHFLSAREPFRQFPFGELVRTVDGQIHRSHYFLAFNGLKVSGYLGWALFDAAVARDFARTAVRPPDELAQGGDVVWLLTAAADSTPSLKAMLEAGQRLYPGLRVMGMRHRSNGRRVLFDREIRARTMQP